MNRERIIEVLDEIRSHLKDTDLEEIYSWFIKTPFQPSIIDTLKKKLVTKVFSKFYQSISEDKILDQFYSQFYMSYVLKKRVKKVDDKYYIYPDFPLNSTKSNEQSNNLDEVLACISQILNTSFNDKSSSFFACIEKKKDELLKENEEKKSELINGTLAPYYGSFQFMQERANYIVKCARRVIISNKVPPQVRKIFTTNLFTLERLLLKFKLISTLKVSEYTKYNMLVNSYKGILKIERSLAKHMQGIWDTYLTKPTQFDINGEYRYLTHTISEEMACKDMNKVCCTLSTNNCFPNISSNGSAGYIMKFNINQVSTMCAEDAGSWIISKREFIDRYLPSHFQLAEEISPGQYVFYECPKLSLFILPWEMESKMIERNLKYYGSATSYEASFYSEIFMRPNLQPLTAIGIFTRDKKGYAKVQKLQTFENLPTVDVSTLGITNNLDKKI